MVPISIGLNYFIQILGHRLHLTFWLFRGMATRDTGERFWKSADRNGVNAFSSWNLYNLSSQRWLFSWTQEALASCVIYLCIYIYMSLYLSVCICMAAQGSKSKHSKGQEMEHTSLLSPLSLEKGTMSEKKFF